MKTEESYHSPTGEPTGEPDPKPRVKLSKRFTLQDVSAAAEEIGVDAKILSKRLRERKVLQQLSAGASDATVADLQGMDERAWQSDDSAQLGAGGSGGGGGVGATEIGLAEKDYQRRKDRKEKMPNSIPGAQSRGAASASSTATEPEIMRRGMEALEGRQEVLEASQRMGHVVLAEVAEATFATTIRLIAGPKIKAEEWMRSAQRLAADIKRQRGVLRLRLLLTHLDVELDIGVDKNEVAKDIVKIFDEKEKKGFAKSKWDFEPFAAAFRAMESTLVAAGYRALSDSASEEVPRELPQEVKLLTRGINAKAVQPECSVATNRGQVMIKASFDRENSTFRVLVPAKPIQHKLPTIGRDRYGWTQTNSW